MIIKSVCIDKETFDDMGVGFSELPLDDPLEMRGLGKLIVLAGPNGAGKSRLLRLIQKSASKHLNAQVVDQIKHDIRQMKGGVDSWIKEAERLNKQLEESGQNEELAGQARQAEINVANIQNNLNEKEKLLRYSSVLDAEGDDGLRIVSFTPKQPKLIDPYHTTLADADQRAERLKHSTDDAQINAPAYAQRIMRLAMECGYERQQKGLLEYTPEEKSRNELVRILEILLGQDVRIGLNSSKLTIGEIEPYPDTLSPGQQVLFQFGCLLHAQHASLADCIVFMDEPENHLHPAVLAQVVENLRKHIIHGQLWIATHSVPLIAQLMADDSDCLWFVKDGKVKRSGRSPEAVLDSLMGGPDGFGHLQNLTRLPAQYAGVRFLVECLEAPGVVGADVNDPQTRQIAKIIQKKKEAKITDGKPLCILDFGAGKGRLLATLRADSPDDSAWLDYYAYDIDNTHQDDCEREIEAFYGKNSKPRWYSDLHMLEAQIGAAGIDVIVICNVLHEIDPSDWLILFAKDTGLHNLMDHDGHLLIVEDYGIPVGERAHRYGFLLLDEPELCKLFEVAEKDRQDGLFVSQMSQDQRYHERLKAHLVGKICVGRITGSTRLAAVKKLHERMQDAVSTFLSGGQANGSADGRAYARSAQLLANTSIWLRANNDH